MACRDHCRVIYVQEENFWAVNRWLIIIFLAVVAVVVLMPKRMMQTENKNNSPERMAQIRRIKKQKAKERAGRAEMKIAS